MEAIEFIDLEVKLCRNISKNRNYPYCHVFLEPGRLLQVRYCYGCGPRRTKDWKREPENKGRDDPSHSQRWRDLLPEHDSLVRTAAEWYRDYRRDPQNSDRVREKNTLNKRVRRAKKKREDQKRRQAARARAAETPEPVFTHVSPAA